MNKKYNYIKLQQPIGDVYIVKMRADFVIDISFSDTRKPYNHYCEIIEGNNCSFEYYNGIQRKLDINRVKSISDYCNTNDAMFPTPIILSASSDYFIINEDTQTLEIPDFNEIMNFERKYCSIVDGQHRLAGIKESKNADKFELIVEFIFDTDPSRDAYLFSIINGNQKPVSKSLIYDLYGLSKSRTVEKLCNKVMRRLNTESDSRLKKSIKMLGYKDELSPKGLVSQARMTDELKKLITDNSYKDNYDIEFGYELRNLDNYKYVFRKYFIKNNDEKIVRLNIEFFNIWLLSITENKEELEIKEESFLEKSLGLSVGYRVMQLLYSHNMFIKNNQDEINVSFEYLYDVLKKMFYEFFVQKKYIKTYYSTEAGMSDLFMELCIILYKEEIIEDVFFKLFLTKNQYDKLSKLVRKENNKINIDDKI